ncbi:hypothetical protein ABFS82_04G053000 [Erythranthe guttata]
MAMSLEDLLAEEGFKRRNAKINPRVSFASEGRGGKQHEPVKRTERTKSDIPRYSSKPEFATSSTFKNRKPRDNYNNNNNNNLSRLQKVESGSQNRTSVRYETRAHRVSEITEVDRSDEIAEVAINRSYKDVYSNKVYAQEGITKNRNSSSFKHAPPQISDNRSDSKISENENIFDTPSIDEAAVKAIISILSGHIKRFVTDEEFRTSLHHKTFASLNFIGLNEGLSTESKVVENLEQAIEIVERAAEEIATLKELKRASLQLSVITGLNSDDLRDGFTSGIANFKLSACAHLYLSVVFTIQNKDRISAKHLLQVFCDSPLQARTSLLPDLWDRLFLPHLSHLKIWYEKETRSVTDSPTNLKILEKAYNECLDSGTYSFAKYYKDWITEGAETPSAPVIKIPSLSFRLMPRGGLYGHASSPASHVSPQTMVSKKLYDEVFRHSRKSGTDSEVSRSSDSPAAEDKQLILYSLKSSADNLPEDPENPMFELKQIEPEPSIQENHENYEKPHSVNSMPEDFLCPLTGLLFEEPVTLETGQTFERESIIDWFNKGFLTCPVTRKTLRSRAAPPVNLILKRVIDKWKTDHFEHLFTLLSREESDESTTVCIIQQLLGVFSKDERIINARRIISSGGLQFLMRRFDSARKAEDKSSILPLLLFCIEADVASRNIIARNINRWNLLELLHTEHIKSRTNAVLLLMELICLNRRNEAKCFFGGLCEEDIISAMDDLLVYLQTCPFEQTPRVAVVLLHFDILSEIETSNVYRQEAVDSITIAIERSLSDGNIRKECSRSLLILGGFFSSSGKLMTEDWILKLAGFLNGPDSDIAEDEGNDITVDATVRFVDFFCEEGEEENEREKWLMSLSASLVGDGKKSFLDTLSKCLLLGNSDFARVCLTTVAWLSFSLNETEFRVCAFSALVSPLKQCLEYGRMVEHKILASFSLLNFSSIPECRLLLMKIGDEIGPCLKNLAEVTWTAKELCTVISRQTR